MRRFGIVPLLVALALCAAEVRADDGEFSWIEGYWILTWDAFTDPLGERHPEKTTAVEIKKCPTGYQWVERGGSGFWTRIREENGRFRDERLLKVTESTVWNKRRPTPPRAVQDELNRRRATLRIEFGRDGDGRMRGQASNWAIRWSGQRLTDVYLRDRGFSMQRVELEAAAVAFGDPGRVLREIAPDTPLRIRLSPSTSFLSRYVAFYVRVGRNVWMYNPTARYHHAALRTDGESAFGSAGRFEFVRDAEQQFKHHDEKIPHVFRIRAEPGDVLEVAPIGGPWQKVATVVEPEGIYPDVVAVPLLPELETDSWGTGWTGRESTFALSLIPEAVREREKLDESWVVLAVHGRGLQRFGTRPPLKAVDSDLVYKTLHCGTYLASGPEGEDAAWRRFWRTLRLRHEFNATEPDLDGRRVYVVAVRVPPGTPAGRYRFTFGGLPGRWSLVQAANAATTRFVRPSRDGRRFTPVREIFKHDHVHVEIETTSDCAAPEIPFELIRGTGDKQELVGFGRGRQRSTTIVARRVGPRLYRSPPIVENRDQLTGWTRRPGNGKREIERIYVGTSRGDRLAAQVVPHGHVRQGPMEIATVRTTPSEVSAFWLEAVSQAAKIAGVPMPAQPAQLSNAQMWTLLRTPWTRISSGPIGGADAFTVDLQLGHLAAMILIRERTIASLQEIRPHVRGLDQRLRENPSRYAPYVHELLRATGSRPGTPMGDIEVARPSGGLANTVSFHKSYDRAWLSRTFGSVETHIREWQQQAVVEAYGHYARALDRSLGTARLSVRRKADGTYFPVDAEDLFELTAIGMQRVVADLRPNLVRRVPDKQAFHKFRWQADPTAVHFITGLETLADEYFAKGKVAEQTIVLAGLALSLGSGVAEVMGARIVAAVISTGGVGLNALQGFGIPDYVRSNAAVSFALGVHAVTGPERYVSAMVRRKPGWALAVELVGGAAEIASAAVDATHALGRWRTAIREIDAEALLAKGPQGLLRADLDTRTAALAHYLRLKRISESGAALSGVESSIVRHGDELLSTPAPARQATRTVRVPAAAREHAASTIRRAHGDYLLIDRSEVATIRQIPTTPPPGPPVGAPGGFADPEAFEFQPGTNWNGFEIDEVIGSGGFMTVYSLKGADNKGMVLKVSRYPDLDTEGDLARALHCRELLGKGIPYVDMDADLATITRGGRSEQVVYAIQERVTGFLHRSRRLTSEQTTAVCELYRKFADAGVIWTDGRLANLIVVEENGKLVAKVTDLDHMWRWSDNFCTGPTGSEHGHITQVYTRFGLGERIRSLEGMQLQGGDFSRVFGGEHIFPDARFFMMKMLEKHGFIRFDPAAGWQDGIMKLEDVRKVFPDFDNPKYVNPDLEALRTGSIERRRPASWRACTPRAFEARPMRAA